MNARIERKSDNAATRIREGELFAAADIGSNSFHLIVARYEHGEPRVIDRLRENIRLAAGLKSDGSLDDAHRDKALACLARFGQRLRGMPSARVRARSARRAAHPPSPPSCSGNAARSSWCSTTSRACARSRPCAASSCRTPPTS